MKQDRSELARRARRQPSGFRRIRGLRIGGILLAWVASWNFISPAPAQTDLKSAWREAELQRIAVIERARQATVCIFAADGGGGGSGVLVDPDGFALTNFHVVQPCGPWMKCGLADGRVCDAVIVGIDPVGDVALIQLFSDSPLVTAPLADSDLVQVGQPCFACGNPFLLATDFQPTVTAGVISGVHRYQYPDGTLLEYADCLQTDAAINPGNSGGPLFNDRGEVIGINGRCSFEKRGRVNVGVGFAISINQVKRFYGHLKVGRVVDHATLGATMATNSSGEVRVANLQDTSEAYLRGLRYDDQLLAFGGRSIRTVNEFKNALGTFPVGWPVPLRYRRSDSDRDIVVRLPGLHAADELTQLIGTAPDVPEPLDHAVGQQPAPELDARYEFRPGFANYYFNRRERRRILDRHAASSQPLPESGKYVLRGHTRQGAPVQLVLNAQSAGLKLADETYVLESDEDSRSDRDSPPRRMLVALREWLRWQQLGGERYGDLQAWGEMPLKAGDPQVYDVLVSNANGLECWFWFDPSTGRLGRIDLSGGTGELPDTLEWLEDQNPPAPGVLPRIRFRTFNDHELEISWESAEDGTKQ